jgi:hypothetical protein
VFHYFYFPFYFFISFSQTNQAAKPNATQVRISFSKSLLLNFLNQLALLRFIFFISSFSLFLSFFFYFPLRFLRRRVRSVYFPLLHVVFAAHITRQLLYLLIRFLSSSAFFFVVFSGVLDAFFFVDTILSRLISFSAVFLPWFPLVFCFFFAFAPVEEHPVLSSSSNKTHTLYIFFHEYFFSVFRHFWSVSFHFKIEQTNKQNVSFSRRLFPTSSRYSPFYSSTITSTTIHSMQCNFTLTITVPTSTLSLHSSTACLRTDASKPFTYSMDASTTSHYLRSRSFLHFIPNAAPDRFCISPPKRRTRPVSPFLQLRIRPLLHFYFSNAAPDRFCILFFQLRI